VEKLFCNRPTESELFNQTTKDGGFLLSA